MRPLTHAVMDSTALCLVPTTPKKVAPHKKGINAAKPSSQMTVVDNDTLDAIGRIVKSLTSLKNGTPLVDMALNNVIAPEEGNNQLEFTDENTEPPTVPMDFITQNK